jgi:hypothetical protein
LCCEVIALEVADVDPLAPHDGGVIPLAALVSSDDDLRQTLSLLPLLFAGSVAAQV